MKNKKTFFFITLITVILVWVSANINWGGDNPKWIVLADGKGYYAYLPAVFIYHDLNYGFFEEKEMNPLSDPKLFYDYRAYHNQLTHNKYFCGTALLQTPFFLAAHLLATLSGGQNDGYAPIYFIFVQIATIFYFVLGLWFLSKLLFLYKYKQSTVIITLLAQAFGTNAFYYVVREAGMSHIYSFALIAAYLYFAGKYFSDYRPGSILALAVAIGLVVLVRPVNGIILLALFFVPTGWQGFKKGLSELFLHPWYPLAGLAIFAAIISIQPILYKISTGSFFTDSYGNEFFNFSNPHLFDFLFSYKKGAFLYTPILFLSLTGFYFFWKTDRYIFYGLLFFLLLLFYVLSSWWNWWYGGSFSSRVLIEFLPVFMLLLAKAIDGFRNKAVKGIFFGLIALCVLVNQIQIYQYRYGMIHFEQMDKQKYWENFLRIDRLL
ncbi:MAG TPA: hypothetical protein PKL96_05965 [Bacteroidales bacterium]|nr:hypothetical protein [Bacteroidales bacterium]